MEESRQKNFASAEKEEMILLLSQEVNFSQESLLQIAESVSSIALSLENFTVDNAKLGWESEIRKTCIVFKLMRI